MYLSHVFITFYVFTTVVRKISKLIKRKSITYMHAILYIKNNVKTKQKI